MHIPFDEPVWMFCNPTLPNMPTGEVEVHGLSLYPGCAASLYIVSGGALYFDIPFHWLSFKPSPPAEMQDLVYANCPSGRAEYFLLPTFSGITLCVFNRNKEFENIAQYKTTIEWPDNNEMLHLIYTDNRLMLWPHHKLTCGVAELPMYNKLRVEWRV